MYWPHESCPGSQSGGAGTKKNPQAHSTKHTVCVLMELPIELPLNAHSFERRTGKLSADSVISTTRFNANIYIYI
jgi:hypothetical protein